MTRFAPYNKRKRDKPTFLKREKYCAQARVSTSDSTIPTRAFIGVIWGFFMRCTRAHALTRNARPLRRYFPAATSSAAISRSLNFCTFIDGVMGKSSTKKTRLGTL